MEPRVTSDFVRVIHAPTSFFSSENCLQAKAPSVDGVESAAKTRNVFVCGVLLITVTPSFCSEPGSSVWIKIDAVLSLPGCGYDGFHQKPPYSMAKRGVCKTNVSNIARTSGLKRRRENIVNN